MEEKHHVEHKEGAHHHTEHKEGTHHHTEHKHHAKKHVKVKKAAVWMSISAILAVLLIISIVTGGFKGGGKTLSSQEAAEKALVYINNNLLQPGTSAGVNGIEDKGSLYNIKLDIGGQEYDSYITKDGGLLFPSAFNLEEAVERTEQPAEQAPPPADLEKSDKPEVQLFIMSHCPFGTQAEKGIIPVAELLGDNIDFEIKFVNYAMHGETEVNEQLSQYCIKAEQNTKFLPYLKCFLEAGDSASCLAEIKVDATKLASCVEKTDTEFKITENLENPTGRYPAFLIDDEKNNEYGVRGSPTLVINDAVVNSARSPSAFLATICSAFNDAPEECDEVLSNANPSSGFGYSEEAGSATAAQCG
jgi:hypothetical protein